MRYTILTIIIVTVGALGFWYFQNRSFPIPEGETTTLTTTIGEDGAAHSAEDNSADSEDVKSSEESIVDKDLIQSMQTQREILITDGVKHSIPLDEILSGGPGKDGIPSIDDPKFVSVRKATFLDDSDPGLGLSLNGESRFYPYRILVWHEIVNDIVGGEAVLVTYCPLCATGIVFDRKVDGEIQEFGVSGRLWQSNLLMYNRAENENDESLWSQVLGEAVLGPNTGERLSIVRSNIVRFGDWKESNPDTRVLSEDTGAFRSYGTDPYNDYYTNESVSFGASFSDTRLHPKALVHGIEINGQFKAYHDESLQGTVTDTFADKDIVVTKSSSGEIAFKADGEPIASIPGFWFSWLAVHEDTELYYQANQ